MLAADGSGGRASTGSLPPGAPAEYVARLVRAARGGIRRAWSPSTPRVRRSGSRPLAGPHLIKVNVDEYERAFGRSGERPLPPSRRTFRSLADRGVETLCLTDGRARRARPHRATSASPCGPRPTDAVSTAGAGDAFLAGLLFALRRGDALIRMPRGSPRPRRRRRCGTSAPGSSSRRTSKRPWRARDLLDADAFFAESRP